MLFCTCEMTPPLNPKTDLPQVSIVQYLRVLTACLLLKSFDAACCTSVNEPSCKVNPLWLTSIVKYLLQSPQTGRMPISGESPLYMLLYG